MLNLNSIRQVLTELTADPTLDPGQVRRFQEAVWNQAEHIVGATREQEEIIRNLAYDLDYFEPNERIRSEDRSFYGEERARNEIAQALRAIERGREA